GGIFAGSNANAFGTAATAVNTWTHLAGTYDGTTLRLYVNGTQVGTAAKTGGIAVSTNPLQIGGDSIYGQYFSGVIDEVRIYNRALSVTEIKNDMNNPVTQGSSPTPTPTPTVTPTPTPQVTPTPTPTPTVTPTVTPTPTPEVTPTPTPTPIATPTPTPTPVVTPTPTPVATPTPTPTPVVTPTPTPV